MKQHITIKQLNELSEKGKWNLRAWMVQKHYVINNNWLPNIGQMIEFLGENQIGLYNNLPFLFKREQDFYELHWEKELCDFLWEAVKEILDKP